MSASRNTRETGGVSLAGHTPGPWAWMGNKHDLYLATTHSGRRYVMGFRRMGTQSAQPVFRVGDRLVPAADLVQFEVGDGHARGFAAGKLDDSVYRYDVSGIDAADARLIAASPDLLNACQAMVRMYEGDSAPGDLTAISSARAAIAKAIGAPTEEGV